MWKLSFICYYRISSLSQTALSPSQHFTLLPSAKAILFFYANFASVQTYSQNIILLASYMCNFCSPHFTSAFPAAPQNGRDDLFLWIIWFGCENKVLFVSFFLCGKKTNKESVKWAMCTLPQALSSVVPCKEHATHAISLSPSSNKTGSFMFGKESDCQVRALT